MESQMQKYDWTQFYKRVLIVNFCEKNEKIIE